MATKRYDVIVVGAGAAGMMGALELILTGKTVAVLEAADRTGGRMHTIHHPRFEKPVELGAEFVHGKLPVTLELLKKAGIEKIKTGGEVWQHKKGELEKQKYFIEDYNNLEKKCKELNHDTSVADFMTRHLGDEKYRDLRSSLIRYVQGYYAGDIAKASMLALCTELATGEEVSYRPEGGYQKLVAYLEEQCKSRGVKFFLSEEVRKIKWKPSAVEVVTDKNSFFAAAALITVSVGVLQSGSITFSPALPQKTAAAKNLGFGPVVKVNLRFSDAFWKSKSFTKGKDLKRLNFLFSDEMIPTWWTQHPKVQSLLVGWLSGPPAVACDQFTKEQLVEEALASLAAIFSTDVSMLQKKLSGAEWHNWSADKNFRGAYSYSVVNGATFMSTILEPEAQTVYFAGEGLHQGNEIGTVEGALASGRTVAHRLIAEFRE